MILCACVRVGVRVCGRVCVPVRLVILTFLGEEFARGIRRARV